MCQLQLSCFWVHFDLFAPLLWLFNTVHWVSWKKPQWVINFASNWHSYDDTGLYNRGIVVHTYSVERGWSGANEHTFEPFIWKLLTRLRGKTPTCLGLLAPASEGTCSLLQRWHFFEAVMKLPTATEGGALYLHFLLLVGNVCWTESRQHQQRHLLTSY
jgi:hypothetical protein